VKIVRSGVYFSIFDELQCLIHRIVCLSAAGDAVKYNHKREIQRKGVIGKKENSYKKLLRHEPEIK
jgi:hypothetical protein